MTRDWYKLETILAVGIPWSSNSDAYSVKKSVRCFLRSSDFTTVRLNRSKQPIDLRAGQRGGAVHRDDDGIFCDCLSLFGLPAHRCVLL
jgi:hypothetical protein